MAKRKKKKMGNNETYSPMEYLQKARQYLVDEQTASIYHFKETDGGNAYKDELRKFVDKNTQFFITQYNKHNNLKQKNFDLKTESVYQKRRKEAIMNYAPIFADKFRGKYNVFRVEEVFVTYNAGVLSTNPDILEKDGYVVLACATYILDELKENGSLLDAICFLPQDTELINTIVLPSLFYDFRFSNDIIRALMFLIFHRDDDKAKGTPPKNAVFLTPASSQRTKENVEPLETQEILNKDHKDYLKHRQELFDQAEKMTYRERFNRILEYMRPSITARAEECFIALTEDYFGNILNGVEKYDKMLRERVAASIGYADKAIAAREKFEKNFKNLDAASYYAQNNSQLSMAAAMNFARSDKPDSSLLTRYSSISNEYELYNSLASDYNKKMETFINSEDDIDSANEEYSIFLMSAANPRNKGSYFDKDKDYLAVEFSIDYVNPFEICFAYLWLVDRGSDLPWLIPLSGSVMSLANAALPWQGVRNQELLDAIHGEHKVNEETDADTTSTEQDNADENVDDVPDCASGENDETAEPEIGKYIEKDPVLWDDLPEDREKERSFFEQKYTDYICWKGQGIEQTDDETLLHWNFPQFIFAMTGMSVPRNIDAFIDDEDALIKSGFRETDLDLLRTYLNLIVEFDEHLTFSCAYGDERDYYLKSAANEETETTDPNSAEELKKTLADKTKKIAELKASLKEAKDDAEHARAKAEALKAEHEHNKQELIELRELVYNLQNGKCDETLDTEATDIQFPYMPKKRIVICGGHISWLQNIRTFLPSVRIIEPDANPDVNVIRNADVVWLQTNAMSHSFYDKIMNVVRQNRTPLKHFAFASAEKCARQLVADDIALNISA